MMSVSTSKVDVQVLTAVKELQELLNAILEHPLTKEFLKTSNDTFDAVKDASQQAFEERVRPLLNSDLPQVSPFLKLLKSVLSHEIKHILNTIGLPHKLHW